MNVFLLIGILSAIPLVTGILIFYWERIVRAITKQVYLFKYPHKVIRIIVRFPGNRYDTIFRLLPDSRRLNIDDGEYYMTENDLAKNKELFEKIVYKTSNKKIVFQYTPEAKFLKDVKLKDKSFDKTYYIDENMICKQKDDDRMPTLEYWFNSPSPIFFNFDASEIQLTSKQLKEYKENDLVSKLLRLNDEKMMFMLMIIISGINLLISVFILAKIMGWVK